MYTVGIITISDKGAAGRREDKSGPKIKELLPKDKYDVVSYKIIPDERKLIADELVRLCDDVKCNLVLTTGGTGFSPRDITPEATMDIAERNAPGIAEALRAYSMSLTPKAMLGRGACSYQEKHTDSQSARQCEGSVGEHGFSDGKYRAWT